MGHSPLSGPQPVFYLPVTEAHADVTAVSTDGFLEEGVSFRRLSSLSRHLSCGRALTACAWQLPAAVASAAPVVPGRVSLLLLLCHELGPWVGGGVTRGPVLVMLAELLGVKFHLENIPLRVRTTGCPFQEEKGVRCSQLSPKGWGGLLGVAPCWGLSSALLLTAPALSRGGH